MSSERTTSDLRLYLRVLRQARPFWRHIVVLFFISALAMPLALLAPVPLKIAVDSVIGEHPLPGPIDRLVPDSISGSQDALLVLAVGLFLAVALLNQLQLLANELLSTYVGERLSLDFRAKLFRHGQRLSLGYHDSRGTSDAVYRIWYDAPSIQWIAVHGVTPFVTAGLTLVAMIAVTASIDWQLALVALAVSPVLVVLTRIYRRRLRRGWKHVKELETSALSVVQEVVGALRVVKAFGQEDREQERFVDRSQATVREHIRVTWTSEALRVLIGLSTATGTAIVLYVGVRHVQTGVITLGELLLIMGYLAQLYLPLQTMSQSIASLQSSLAGAERAFALLDEAPDVAERPGARPLERAAGDVSFQRVSFAYEGDHKVLEAVSLDVPAGTRVGVVGATGAGKTTLVGLLTRFYDPDDGAIRLDGVDLREYRVADLRNQFAIVLQEPVLFSTTIAENIAYARPEATQAEIERAAAAANAHAFISALPDGYETPVGERGMRLSGGERQRISLARAFLKDAPILVLDEPTSSVDNRTEAMIMEAMERLMQGRTTFTIAHRLTTLLSCDLLVEIEQGTIASARSDVRNAIDGALAASGNGASAGADLLASGVARPTES
jgi:ATP-binding cassette, subfamily B, bacterial